MTPNRYQQVAHIYHQAAELEPDERAHFLDRVCAGDLELRNEVEALIASGEQAGEFLDRPAMEVAARQAVSEKDLSCVGQRLGHYQVLSVIGAGGMGEVYLAQDTALGRKVALKVLPTRFTSDARRLARFVREARAASTLNHPNILTIYEIGEAGGVHFIATEFVEGVTLRQQLANGRLELRAALDVTRQVAAALRAAHSAGVVHRDIKPENVMVRPDGLVKVLDFGLATMTELQPELLDTQAPTPATAIKTEPGMVMGTPRYMSPEQARGWKTDARTDVFSLGVMLYEMLAGAPPFAGATPPEVFAALLEKDPPPLADLAPEALEEIVNKALAKDRDARYQSAEEFAQDLDRFKDEWQSWTDSTDTLQLGAATAPRVSRRTTAAPEPRTNTSAVSQPALTAPISRWSKARSWRLLLALLAVALGVGLYQLFGNSFWRRSSSVPFNTMTFTNARGAKGFPCFSPDGNQIVYSWDGGIKELNGKRDIYIKVIGVGEPLRLTTAPEEDLYPAWAPDGKYIAFLRFYGGEGRGRHELYLIPPLGGKERKLADAAYSGISWAPDSKTLAFSSASTTEEPSGIYLLSPETGERRKLTTASVAPLSYDVFPTFSPDGKNVAFLRYYISSSLDLYVVPATGGTPKQLTFDKRDIRGLTWTADSRELVYAVNRELRRIPAAGGASERIPISGQNPSYPSISRQGNRLAYANEYNDSNIYQYEGPGFASGSAPGKFGEATPILTSNLEDTSPQFSPDGRWIVFVSFRNDSEDLWLSDRDGKNPAQLTNLKSPTGTPRWSPDGRWIVFDSRSRGSADIYVISPDGGQPRAITTEPSAETKPSWSSDGKWIYFNSNRSGQDQIWKIPAAGGAAQQVTKSGAFEGFESADGQTFYFSKGRRVYGIWSMPVAGGEEKPVPELSQAGYWRSWGVLKEGIYYITKEETKQQTIRFFGFATRRISPLLAVDKEPLIWNPGLSLAADGRRLLYAQLDYVVDDILLLENFR